MGQKVNPVGLRLGINRGWDSVWYAKKKDFGNYLIEDFKISGLGKVRFGIEAVRTIMGSYAKRNKT